MYAIILTYTKPLEEMDALRPAHLAFLDEHYASGLFMASGRQNPPVGGVILARDIELEKLEAIMKQDPFYIEKAATHQIIAFNPNKFGPGVQELIEAA